MEAGKETQINLPDVHLNVSTALRIYSHSYFTQYMKTTTRIHPLHRDELQDKTMMVYF